MKELVQRIYAHPNYVKALKWGRLLTFTGAMQMLVKAIGLISGILVIRMLPTQEYALYTLANTMLGTLTLLSDGGVSAGVMANGGKVWQDRTRLGAVLTTGLYLRKRFAIGSLLIAIPALLLLLRHHEVSWLMAGLVIVSIIPAFFAALSGTLYEVAPKLKQDIAPLQKVHFGANLGRLALLGLVLFAFPWAFAVVLAAGIPQIWANRKMRKMAHTYADWDQKPDLEVQKKILALVKRIFPGALYYCISGQITIWLISIFGSTTALAQVGALSRLAMALSFFQVLFTTLIVPRFARLPDQKKLLKQHFLGNQAGLIGLSLFIIAFVSLFSEHILWVLGDDFSGLHTEVTLITVGSCLSMISACTHQLLSARGIIVPPLIFISFAVAVQVGVAFSIRLDEVEGVLLYGIYSSAAIYAIRIMYLFYILKKHEVSDKD